MTTASHTHATLEDTERCVENIRQIPLMDRLVRAGGMCCALIKQFADKPHAEELKLELFYLATVLNDASEYVKEHEEDAAESEGSNLLEKPSCPKCQGTDLRPEFIAQDSLINHSARSRSYDEFVYSSEYRYFWRWTARKDHLHIKCGTCGADWREAPKTTEKKL